MARRLTASRHDVDDAVQEIFVQLWKSAARFDPLAGTERMLVSVLARRRLIDRMRRRRTRPDTVPLTDDLLTVLACSRSLDDSAEFGIACNALRDLPPRQQLVIALSVISGLSHSEIARSAGIPLGTVKTLVRRGMLTGCVTGFGPRTLQTVNP